MRGWISRFAADDSWDTHTDHGQWVRLFLAEGFD